MNERPSGATTPGVIPCAARSRSRSNRSGRSDRATADAGSGTGGASAHRSRSERGTPRRRGLARLVTRAWEWSGISLPWELVCLMFLATAFRLFPWPPVVTHFDEGVYASNLWCGPETGFRFPNQHLYAPPLLGWLIEWALTLGGPSNGMAILPSLIAGVATVALVWSMARHWYGREAAFVAGLCASTSGLSTLLSRAALTDVLLVAWLLGAIHLYWQTVADQLDAQTGDPHGGRSRGRSWQWLFWSAMAGLLAGLAWWTKYTGWLALAICGSGAAGWWLARRSSDGLKSAGVPFVIMAIVAILVWLPWLNELQAKGGYAAVSQNHAGYVVGWSGWWMSASTQWLHLVQLDGRVWWVTLAGMVLWILLPDRPQRFPGNADQPDSPSTGGGTAAGASTVSQETRRAAGNPVSRETTGRVDSHQPAVLQAANDRMDQVEPIRLWAWQRLVGGLVLLLAGILFGSTGLFVALAVMHGLGMVLRSVSRETDEPPAVGLADWVLLAWICGLSLSIPLYTPYPRLMLPWQACGWLLAASCAKRQGPAIRQAVWSCIGRLPWSRVKGVRSASSSPPPGTPPESSLPAPDAAPPEQPRLRDLICRPLVMPLLFGLLWATHLAEMKSRAADTAMFTTARDLANFCLIDAGLPELAPAAVSTAPHDEVAIYLYGAPELFFQMHLLGLQYAVPTSHLAFAREGQPPPRIPTFVVLGDQAVETSDFAEQMQRAKSRLRHVATLRTPTPRIVRLDRGLAADPVSRWQVYRVRDEAAR